jgi:hypothetical protein
MAFEQTGKVAEAIEAYEKFLEIWKGDDQYRIAVTERLRAIGKTVEP